MKGLPQLLVILMLGTAAAGHAQGLSDLQLLRDAREVDIPFEYQNDFIIVQILFNNIFPLKFILDTGAENTVLTQRAFADLLQVNYQRRFPLMGADMSTELYAYLASGITLRVGQHLLATNRNILVLEEDYFRFEEFAGISVQGILGADFLRRFVMRINYKRRVITLIDPSAFQPDPDEYVELPIEFYRYRPYIKLPVNTAIDQSKNLKFLIDTGAGLSILLHPDTDSSLIMPEQIISAPIGMGLGGFLEGYVGRSHHVSVGPYTLDDVITYYQDLSPYIDTSFLNQRNGILGNRVLNRFEIVLDYVREKFYVKPARDWRRSFDFDRSGLNLGASGDNLHTFVVLSVLHNSPAGEAGLLPGDQILSINGVSTRLMLLSSINKKLRQKVGKRIRLKLLRGEEKMVVEFTLRDLI